VTENAAISAIEHVASVTILIIRLVIGTSCMLRLRALIQSNVLTPACFEHSWRGIQKNEIWCDSNVVLCRSMSATGQTRTSRPRCRMSVSPPGADIRRPLRHEPRGRPKDGRAVAVTRQLVAR